MPHSILLGRGWPGPGEPLFTRADTDLAVALAEEERDTCPACGLPKAWCRDNDGGRYRFDIDESFCWATYRLGERTETKSWQKTHAKTRNATQLSVRFREGRRPSMAAGLNFGEVSRG